VLAAAIAVATEAETGPVDHRPDFATSGHAVKHGGAARWLRPLLIGCSQVCGRLRDALAIGIVNRGDHLHGAADEQEDGNAVQPGEHPVTAAAAAARAAANDRDHR